jgi:aminoglycoside phosphotransferase (APT) family kinase protein
MTLPPLVDEDRLRAYLALHVAGADAPVRAEKIPAGHSNETFLVTRGAAEQWVLRRPPRGPLLPTAHDVLREYRVMTALYYAGFTVPQPLLACEDMAVIGAPFYLMERVDGIVMRDNLPPDFASPADCAAIADQLIRTLVTLHAVDYHAAGLAALGKPDGYIARQIKRWMGQLDGARTRPQPDLDAVSLWLQTHMPESPPATIVHGDFRIDNVMLAPRPPAREVAVLEREMSTLGDPLADLGYLLSFWREPGEAPFTPLPDEMGNITSQPGFPSRAVIAARYEELSGRKMTHLSFYVVLAIWKLAILLEGSYKRHLAGTTDDPFFALLDEGVPALARRASALTQAAA